MSTERQIALVNDLAEAIAYSGLFECKSIHQAKVFAYSCMVKRADPLTLTEQYHIIDIGQKGSRLSMKAEAMLAGFRGIGGRHKIIQCDSDAVAIDFYLDDQVLPVKITWADAQAEKWPYTKDGQLKDNWSTPEGRTDMLFARVCSRGVKRLAPEVIVGKPTPQEVADFEPEAYLEGPDLATAATQAPETLDSEPQVPKQPPAEKAASEPPVAPAAVPKCSDEMAKGIVAACRTLGKDAHDLAKVLRGQYDVHTLAELTAEQANDLFTKLQELIARAEPTVPQSSPQPDPPAAAGGGPSAAAETPQAAAEPQRITKAMIDTVMSYFVAMEVPPDVQLQLIRQAGAESLAEVQLANGESLIARLQQAAESRGISPYAGSLDDQVDPQTVEEIRSAVGELVQLQPDAPSMIAANLAQQGLKGIADLTVREAKELLMAIREQSIGKFFEKSIEGWRAKNSDTAGQQ